MRKIKRIKITSTFKPMDMSQVKVGDVIDFDCYIQRFDDMVIIITAGTKITDKEITLLSKSDKHFVEYKEYKRLFPDAQKEESMVSCYSLKDKLQDKQIDYTSESKKVYDSIVHYMEGHFTKKHKLKLECIDEYIHFLVSSIHKKDLIFKLLLEHMSHENRHSVHSTNVMVLALALANYLNYSFSQIKLLAKAAILHDLGKADIDKSLYEKKGKLNEKEFSEMKKHPFYSYQEAQKLGVDDSQILNIILHHHEFLDGSGYPNGLQGSNISPFTRIVTVCDMFDAMTSERNFRDKKTALESLKIMKIEYKHKLHVKFIDDFIKLISKAYAA
ncbi:HD domain-containing protein [Sulfurimonas aquatica]|uniref:HD domain-containing protein n=1 Tax=Sulfurimonas aquatica TaxID=2672570 RepID=A0A975GCJ2_9BACT|nr:HD domain-containing phosphohydrolase [Sulfurimonas aquatica]QSZ41334.1 HD domain-containing protein [Sulfurimonas aquatica]